jgi:hypothetical protein
LKRTSFSEKCGAKWLQPTRGKPLLFRRLLRFHHLLRIARPRLSWSKRSTNC